MSEKKSLVGLLQDGLTIRDVVLTIWTLLAGSGLGATGQYFNLSPIWYVPMALLGALIAFCVGVLITRAIIPNTAADGYRSPSWLLLIAVIASFLVGRWTADRRPTVKEWSSYMAHLETISHRDFMHTEVVLDGKNIEDSTLRSTTFVYKGERPFHFAHNNFSGGGNPLQVKVLSGPQFDGAMLIWGMALEVCRAQRAALCDAHFIQLYEIDESGEIMKR